ncbi:molecular chaperone GroES [Variovorax paradoxus]|jgi:fimbrial chaperone protein|nr:molecular chaperone GroES [Variovorax paradoxus]KPV04539.1 molecular chaperone GroES [Variovorax paradoxus]KPV05958.1 molecular chaperone GroES [Variovorax paradoxus]KPV18391.1 molecular chaperone GroES [Variovorax paradoxus]KPV25184.1 molecular chaperone GroES [Variovorax paradoxus]
MCNKQRFFGALGAALVLGFSFQADAAVALSGTRVVLGEKEREASIPMRNTGGATYVIQAWVDAGEGRNNVPLLVTPPLSRLDPGKENILRIMRMPGELPGDRESVFWLNVKEIPEKAQEENVLQIAVRTRIKLFYRPAALVGQPLEARRQLQWGVGPGLQGQGAVLKIRNPTVYHVTFTGLNVNAGQQKISAAMVEPFGDLSFPLDALKSPQPVEVRFTTLNDYGSETPEERVRVPVGTEPVAVTPEPVEAIPGGDVSR